jgi:uronate dehydrogenase
MRPSTTRRVLLTGAAGRIGTALTERLPAFGWDLRLFDRDQVPGGIVGDVTSPADLDAAMAGVDAVVHLAGQPTEAPWPVIREANIEGTLQLFEAARRAGVRRVVYASSNHAVGFTPLADNLPADVPPRPDTLYGVSKVFGEALGRYYVDRYDMQVACLRIGTFEDRPSHPRSLGTWLSADDAARLVDACLRSSALNYAIVWGISANTRRAWSLDAGRALGYEPHDDAEDHLADIPDADPHPSDAFVGGGFTSAGFGIDEVTSRS